MLERRFRLVLDRTPLEEIRQVRLERARQLLRETDLQIPAVADRSGFGNAVRFAATFRQDAGQSPSAYRRLHRLR